MEVISGKRGRLLPLTNPETQLLELDNAFVYKQTREDPDLIGRFRTLSIWTPTLRPDPVGYKPKATSTQRLFGSALDEDRAELQWRLSTAASTVLLALVAVPLGRSRPRGGRYGRVLLAVAVYAIYFNLIGIARSGVEQGTLDHLWWAPLGLGGLVALGLVASRRIA